MPLGSDFGGRSVVDDGPQRALVIVHDQQFWFALAAFLLEARIAGRRGDDAGPPTSRLPGLTSSQARSVQASERPVQRLGKHRVPGGIPASVGMKVISSEEPSV